MMNRHGTALCAVLVLAASGAGVTGAVAQQPARTLQQEFDAATALDGGTDPAPALAAWTAFEARARSGSRTWAIAQVRKGGALAKLERYDEAAAAIRSGLATLPKTDNTLTEDRMLGHLVLGRISLNSLDYAGAATEFAAAEAIADQPGDKLGALIGLVQAQTFTDPAAASDSMARADRVMAATPLDNTAKAAFERRRTLLLLSQNRLAPARDSALLAVKLLGGLSMKTELVDVSARQDAALALLLLGDEDEARRYMALTGAGRMTRGSFDPASEMEAPECGGEAGLKPDDMAVIEFNIAPDGSVSRPTPIYSSGGGKVALEFARAARNWSWPAADVAKLPAFFRYNARVEMRCSTAFARPSVNDTLQAALARWLTDKGIALPETGEKAAASALAEQRAVLAKAEAGGSDTLSVLAALVPLASNPVLPREEAAALYARALPIAVRHQAPAAARLGLDVIARTGSSANGWKPGFFQRKVEPLLTDPAYQGDPQARAALRLMLADKRQGDERALTLLRQVADDKTLEPGDMLRVGALIRIASIEQRRGAPDAARAAFAASGVTATQCAVLDTEPKFLTSAGMTTFPQDALVWGFEGWTQVQSDVMADGRPANTRALLSYPPFIFTKSATNFFSRGKYAKTYRPDGGLGCGGVTKRIRFSLGA